MLRVVSKNIISKKKMTMMKRQKLFLYTAAAAAAASSTTCQVDAWVIAPTRTTTTTTTTMTSPYSTRTTSSASTFLSTQQENELLLSTTNYNPINKISRFSPASSSSSSVRLYSSRRGGGGYNDDEEDENILSKIGKKVKSFLPTKWFGSDEEKLKLQRRKQVKEEVNGSLNQILKDAPLGIRMMGKMISPLMSSVASTMAETLAEQQRTTEMLLDDAKQFLVNDPAVTQMIGLPIQIGNPFQQSSSTMTVNGKTQSRTELAFSVNGSKGSGVARLVASNQDGISQLLFEGNGGRLVNVSLTKRKWNTSTEYTSSSSSRGGGGGGDDDNIIEAEIIEKRPSK